jgi:hypothetical protein
VLRSYCVVATAAVLSVLSATLSPERTDRDAMELPFDGPEPGPELQSAEAAEPVGGGLYDFLSAVWRLRLSEEAATGPGRAMAVETLFNSDSSSMLAEPSRLILERTAAGIMRRTLSSGAFFINRRFAIAAAERIGKDPADPPVGSGTRLGRRYTAARLLHVRMVSSRAAVAVVLCRAKSEADGQETRVVVTTTVVDGVLFDQTLQQSSATPADGAEEGGERRPEWKIVHEDVSVGGLLANVPVLAMPPLGGGAVEGESQIATAWPAELSDWYLGTKAAAAVRTHRLRKRGDSRFLQSSPVQSSRVVSASLAVLHPPSPAPSPRLCYLASSRASSHDVELKPMNSLCVALYVRVCRPPVA